MSPCLTRKLCRTTRFMRALPSSRSSSARTIRTVSFRFLPFTSTVSPLKSCSVSMVLFERAIIELSSLTASVTLETLLLVTYVTADESIIHQGIRLLLLLENGGCRVIHLIDIVSSQLRGALPLPTAHLFLFGAGGITDLVLALRSDIS